MDYYLDMKIVPDAEVPIYFIRNKVYTKLHRALSTLNATYIGVSFPKFNVKLGNTIRIHGTVDSLSKLQDTNWLGGLSGYCVISEIQPVPSDVSYRTVSRKQSNMSASKLRRLINRGSISADEVNQYKTKMLTQGLDDPYLELESSSNGNRHRRYIQVGELLAEPVLGEFDHFGLSKTATIPWF